MEVQFESGHHEALVLAGANVLDFWDESGWSGRWIALVEYDGRRGFALGWFGSCSGCDELQATEAANPGRCTAHRYMPTGAGSDCARCGEAKAERAAAVADVGRDALSEGLSSADEAVRVEGLSLDALKFIRRAWAEHGGRDD